MTVPKPDDSLDAWLEWLELLHPTEIEMGLQRVGAVADRLNLRPSPVPLILVGGTNGKGSTVALLSEIYTHAGCKVGAYTSPHIDVFNERMRVNGEMLDDQSIVNGLHQIESYRLPETLTYFEYTTLAAMIAFKAAGCDLVVMEVGLGGRLDATNLWDCDCAIITSIALDHQDYLGDTLDAIAREKVAIGRKDTPLIVGDLNPPTAIQEVATKTGMRLQQINLNKLPVSNLKGDHQRRNAACALMAVDALQHQFTVNASSIEAGLKAVAVSGRFEKVVIDGQLAILDVAHNPAAAETVKDALAKHYPDYRVYAIFSALKDKDLVGIVSALAPAVSSWYCAELSVPRATPLDAIINTIEHCQSAPVKACASVLEAWSAAVADIQKHASTHAEQRSLVLVAGSFSTLSELRESTARLPASSGQVDKT